MGRKDKKMGCGAKRQKVSRRKSFDITPKTCGVFSAAAANHLWSKCKEHPGHTNFIPVTKFTSKNLPAKYRKTNLIDYIKILSDLTVRIVVKINPGRPGNKVVAGTGTVTEMLFDSQRVKCGCPHCLTFKIHQLVCGDLTNRVRIRILTAFHVVPGCLEAQNSSVDFFFDDESDMKKVKTLQGVCIYSKSAVEDWSVFECVTSDRNLVGKLKSSFDGIGSHSNQSTAKAGDLAIIVSHPHGRSKHISIGRWVVEKAEYPAQIRCFDVDAFIMELYYTFYVNSSLNLPCIFRRNLFSTHRAIVNIDGKSEVMGIECDVSFPDDTKSMCQIWQLDKPVKDTKKFLMMEGNIHDPEEDLYLEMELPDGQTQMMDDEKDLDYYWEAFPELIQSVKVVFPDGTFQIVTIKFQDNNGTDFLVQKIKEDLLKLHVINQQGHYRLAVAKGTNRSELPDGRRILDYRRDLAACDFLELIYT